jgi:hypothetical protein
MLVVVGDATVLDAVLFDPDGAEGIPQAASSQTTINSP